MRPHVELIQQADLCWHAAELPKGEGKVRQRNMSYDEENGGASTKLVFDSSWHRPAGYHHADTEWYVLAGEVRFGSQVLRKGAARRPPTARTDTPDRSLLATSHHWPGSRSSPSSQQSP